MNYLLTGATGLLGASLLNHLKKQNNKITCLIHQKQNKITKTEKINTISGDLLNYPLLVRASQYADIIIHAAAVIIEKNPQNYYSVNVIGTINLLKAAHKNGIKQFIYISSWANNPRGGDYANSKYLAEQQVKRYPKYSIIRPADIYSLKRSHLHNFIKTIEKLPVIPIFSKGEYQISPVFVEDVTKAIIYLINKGPNNRIITIIGPKIYSYNKFVHLLRIALNIRKPIIAIPKLIAYPILWFTDKLHLPLPMNLEQYRRLTTHKLINNPFDFAKAGIKPLEFVDFLAKLTMVN